MENLRVEIEIDRTTLPQDGQKVRWQTHQDFNNEIWKEGVFCSGDDLFVSNGAPDLSFHVLHWEAGKQTCYKDENKSCDCSGLCRDSY